MQCNNCGGRAAQFHETAKTSHDSDKDNVIVKLYQCQSCDGFGRQYVDKEYGRTTNTGIFR